MNDLGVHLLLFLVVSVAIVLIGSFYSDAHNGPALRSVPRRLLVFLAGCTVLAVIMLVLEHTVASVD